MQYNHLQQVNCVGVLSNLGFFLLPHLFPKKPIPAPLLLGPPTKVLPKVSVHVNRLGILRCGFCFCKSGLDLQF